MPASDPAVTARARTLAIWPLVPTRSFDDPLTYELEPGADVVVGSLVEIPVGNAARVGVVAALDVEVPDGVRLKAVSRVLDLPAVPAALVGIADWLAHQYGCATTVALSLVVPPQLSALARASTVPVRRSQQALRRTAVALPGELSPRLRTLALQLRTEWEAVAEVVARLRTTRPTLQRLVTEGIVEIEERFVEELGHRTDTTSAAQARPATRADDSGLDSPRGLSLTPAQIAAVEACEAAIGERDPAIVLRGITGSGKTEVYLELIDRALARGRGAIVLVPEIALTPQTARRFNRRFPGVVEVLHSGMTRAERAAAWQRIAAAESRVVVGPRSAVFAPVDPLGVLVIDEEHDGSYKQDSEPRYDARRVAWRRAQEQCAVVVYGSATPRPETWHGVRRRVQLLERPGGGRLAPVELVDLRDHGDAFPLTEPVADAIGRAVRNGGKAIVLHNRRGYATVLICHTCGYRCRCPNCDVSLVIHGASARSQQLVCHHCGHVESLPGRCPGCNAADIARAGAGTERLEQELQGRFGAPVFRLDADATRERGGVGEILAAFGDQPGAAILTGTQMVAKGHDFPDVELAVVVDADGALAIPDFRAEERAFSLVAQLAGRAGRSAGSAARARVLVQTWDPEQEFLRFARAHDVEGFLAAELERRCEHSYPPFSRLVRALVSAPDERAVERWAQAVAQGMRQLEAGRVLGPAPLIRLSGRQRAQVLIKTPQPVAIAGPMRSFLRRTAQERTRHDVRIVLDVDPQSLV